MADVISERDEWMRRTGPLYPGLVALWSQSPVPVPQRLDLTGDDEVRGAAWFPVFGGALGVVLAMTAKLLLAMGLVPALAAVVVVVLALGLTAARLEIAMTGLFERLAAGHTPLSRPGSLSAPGVIALVAFLALRGAGLYGTATGHWLAALVIAPMSARWAALFLVQIGDRLPEASIPGRYRDPRRPGALPAGRVSWLSFAISSAAVVAIALLLGWGAGVLALVVVVAVAFAGGLYIQRRAGGLTDHSLATMACACEIAALVVFAAVYPGAVVP